MKLLVIKNIMIDTMILLMLSFLYFTPLWCNIFDSIILLYSTYRLKINFKFHTNPHHFLIDFILIISYALFLFMIKISLFTYLNVVLYIFLFSIKLSYVVYNTTFLEGLYNNYIDFYNINIKIFIPFAMFYVFRCAVNFTMWDEFLFSKSYRKLGSTSIIIHYFILLHFSINSLLLQKIVCSHSLSIEIYSNIYLIKLG